MCDPCRVLRHRIEPPCTPPMSGKIDAPAACFWRLVHGSIDSEGRVRLGQHGFSGGRLGSPRYRYCTFV
jgi:hypothetical protein